MVAGKQEEGQKEICKSGLQERTVLSVEPNKNTNIPDYIAFPVVAILSYTAWTDSNR